MHRLSACVAVGAMLFALVTAPLFHVHDGDDDHGHAESLVHAHLPESEPADYSGQAVDHPEEHGRSIDLFAVNTAAPATYQVVAEFSEPLTVDPPLVTRAVLSVQALRSHSPPEQSHLPARSPPIL
jgi:hypothetical protein